MLLRLAGRRFDAAGAMLRRRAGPLAAAVGLGPGDLCLTRAPLSGKRTRCAMRDGLGAMKTVA
ncbi:hypothetical protein R69749_03119 [Paraburkholderia domus]|nr:hypothetical protein R70006_02693 [Paraburkholderia domus]CAE6811925.1 hypothetical protein R69749_03119 [Paraburkholderia domus]CAE6850438.1 hypothetical protein R70199_00318 [Paraburkholderia domus]